MTSYQKKMYKIIIKAKNDMYAVRETVIMERKSLEQNIREKYPVDYYGIKADLIIDEKSKKIDEDLKRADLLCTGLCNILEDVEV